MATRNDITGDELKTGSSTEAYRDGWDRIFGKKPGTLQPLPENIKPPDIEWLPEHGYLDYPETDEGNTPD